MLASDLNMHPTPQFLSASVATLHGRRAAGMMQRPRRTRAPCRRLAIARGVQRPRRTRGIRTFHGLRRAGISRVPFFVRLRMLVRPLLPAAIAPASRSVFECGLRRAVISSDPWYSYSYRVRECREGAARAQLLRRVASSNADCGNVRLLRCVAWCVCRGF